MCIMSSYGCSAIRNISITTRFHQTYSKCRNFSTVPAIHLKENCHFRTSENDPTLHTSNHIGKYYLVPPHIKNILLFSGGISKVLETQMDTFRETCIMVREPAIEINSLLQKFNYDNPAIRFILHGKSGTGKTTTLMHVLHYAYASKFLLIHIPWASNWTKRPKEIVNSQFKERRIDLPVESAIWLQHFKLQNEHLMEELQLKTSKSYSWSIREETAEGSPLMDVVEHGIQRARHSSDCIAVLLKEIKQQSQSGKFKTMVIVDGVNAFFNKTNVRRADKSLVPASEITIVHALLKLLDNNWNNAAIVTSVDIIPYNRYYSIQDPETPYLLLGKEGFELMNPFIPIQTKNFTDLETDSMIDYYIDRLWLTSERIRGEDGRKQLKFLSGYNPYMLMKLCDPL